jgi:hypothetical protein
VTKASSSRISQKGALGARIFAPIVRPTMTWIFDGSQCQFIGAAEVVASPPASEMWTTAPGFETLNDISCCSLTGSDLRTAGFRGEAASGAPIRQLQSWLANHNFKFTSFFELQITRIDFTSKRFGIGTDRIKCIYIFFSEVSHNSWSCSSSLWWICFRLQLTFMNFTRKGCGLTGIRSHELYNSLLSSITILWSMNSLMIWLF